MKLSWRHLLIHSIEEGHLLVAMRIKRTKALFFMMNTVKFHKSTFFVSQVLYMGYCCGNFNWNRIGSDWLEVEDEAAGRVEEGLACDACRGLLYLVKNELWYKLYYRLLLKHDLFLNNDNFLHSTESTSSNHNSVTNCFTFKVSKAQITNFTQVTYGMFNQAGLQYQVISRFDRLELRTHSSDSRWLFHLFYRLSTLIYAGNLWQQNMTLQCSRRWSLCKQIVPIKLSN